MKSYLKASFFLVIVYILDLILRKGMIPIPLPFPSHLSYLILYALFAILVWFITKRFARSDGQSLSDLGVDFRWKNRRDFLWGLAIGIIFWGAISLIQAWIADTKWIVRPGVSLFSVIYGFVFIFLADLGTELYFRAYPLTKFKENYGSGLAILIMTIFVGAIS